MTTELFPPQMHGCACFMQPARQSFQRFDIKTLTLHERIEQAEPLSVQFYKYSTMIIVDLFVSLVLVLEIGFYRVTRAGVEIPSLCLSLLGVGLQTCSTRPNFSI